MSSRKLRSGQQSNEGAACQIKAPIEICCQLLYNVALN